MRHSNIFVVNLEDTEYEVQDTNLVFLFLILNMHLRVESGSSNKKYETNRF